MLLQYVRNANHTNHKELITVANANNVFLEWIIIVCG